MISAVVLVNANAGEDNMVLGTIRCIEEIEEAHALWGVYDLIVKINANSIVRIKDTIKFRLRRLAGVNSILTLMMTGMPPSLSFLLS